MICLEINNMSESKKQLANTRKFHGEVVSTAMNKTIIVRVDSMVMHSKYNKNYKEILKSM